MMNNEHIEWLRKQRPQYNELAKRLKTEHLDALQAGLDRLLQENEELFDYVESVADWIYRGDGGSDEYGEGAVQNEAKKLVKKIKMKGER